MMQLLHIFTMAALEAATQPASVSERKDSLLFASRTLGGRVKPGHGEWEEAWN
jgi:hypothetical protein